MKAGQITTIENDSLISLLESRLVRKCVSVCQLRSGKQTLTQAYIVHSVCNLHFAFLDIQIQSRCHITYMLLTFYTNIQIFSDD